jgi:hypothetical protein
VLSAHADAYRSIAPACLFLLCSNEDEDAEAPSLQEDLGWGSKVDSVADVAVPERAELKQAGCIMSLLEGMVVVQGLANSRALDAG